MTLFVKMMWQDVGFEVRRREAELVVAARR
jgi:hypothetical protein